MQELTDKMERLEKSSQTSTEQGGAFIEKYKEYTELETLTAEIANDVVKRVTVYKDGGIEIELALRDELEKLLTCLETVDAARDSLICKQISKIFSPYLTAADDGWRGQISSVQVSCNAGGSRP